MGQYELLTTWCLDAPIERVFDVLHDSRAYELSFDTRVTRVERPHLLEGTAAGELEGTGTWRLYEGRGTAAVYEWRVRTTRAWMNVLGPVVRPDPRRRDAPGRGRHRARAGRSADRPRLSIH